MVQEMKFLAYRSVGVVSGLLVVLVQMLLAPLATAHTSSTGLARIEFRGNEAQYRLMLSPTEVGNGALPVQRGAAGDASAAQQAIALLHENVTMAVGDQPCRVRRSRIQASNAGSDQVSLLLDWQCSAAPGTLVLRDTLAKVFGEHYRTIASISRVADADPSNDASGQDTSGRRQEHILDRDHTQVRVDFGQVAPSGLSGFLRLGLNHILSGFDHLLFLAALLLGSRSLRSLLITVTAFTAAHSLSLAAATLGWLHVSGNWVEPAIAASIIWVAIENLLLASKPLRRHALTFGFGLVHGLAFAEALTELQLSGWPLARALLGFHLGVETGQALVVLVLAPALSWMARHAIGPRVERAFSVVIAAIGLVWLAQRLALV